MRWQWRCGLLLALLVALLPLAPVRAATTFTDPQGQFSLIVPDGFQRQNPPPIQSIAAFTTPMLKDAFFGVDATAIEHDGTLPTDLDALLATLTKDLGRDTVIAPEGIQRLTLDGIPGRRIDVLTVDRRMRYHAAIVIAIRGEMLFGLFFQARECDFPTLAQLTSTVLPSVLFMGDPSFQRTGTGSVHTVPLPPIVNGTAPNGACVPQNINRRLGDG